MNTEEKTIYKYIINNFIKIYIYMKNYTPHINYSM